MTAIRRRFKSWIRTATKRAGVSISSTRSVRSYERHVEGIVAEFEQYYVGASRCGLNSNQQRARLMTRLLGTNIIEALHIAGALQSTRSLPGDVCEFGVAQGATSALIANEISPTDKMLWLFDSFQGLPAPTEKDRLIDDIFGLGTMAAYEGTMACGKDLVLERLSEISFPQDRTRLVEGFIEKTLPAITFDKGVSFAYIDLDFYLPIQLALNKCHAFSRPGAVLIVDDYGFFSDGAQAAVDEFLGEHRGKYAVQKHHGPTGHFAVLARTA